MKWLIDQVKIEINDRNKKDNIYYLVLNSHCPAILIVNY